jgi:Cu/Ag efflux protein CusF
MARVEDGKGTHSVAELVTASAVVEAIDQKSRMVTLKDHNGQRLRFKVSDDVKNLQQVKKGDQVNVSYYESVMLQLRKPGDATPGVTVAEEAERAKPGELPAGAVAEVVTVTAKVVEVDRRGHRATLELPNTEKLTVKVNDPARLQRVRSGDLVEATYREAIAVAVERPATR